jgi:hypothetical protein
VERQFKIPSAKKLCESDFHANGRCESVGCKRVAKETAKEETNKNTSTTGSGNSSCDISTFDAVTGCT